MDEDVQHLLRKRQYRVAFEHLLDRYETKVFRMALTFLKDQNRAEDATQEIFLKLLQGLPDYDGRASGDVVVHDCAEQLSIRASLRRVPQSYSHRPHQ